MSCPQCGCSVVEVVNIPGAAGASACTTVTADFVVPAAGSNVTVTLENTSQLIVGSEFIADAPAHFSIVSISSPTQAVVKFLNEAGDVVPGTTITSTSLFCPSGQGGVGQNGYAITTSNFTVPSVGTTVKVPVDNSKCFVVGEYVISTGPANFIVTALPATTSVTIRFIGNPNDVAPGTVVPSGSTIASAGEIGGNAWTTNTIRFTIPAIGANVTNVDLADARWMVVGQNVVFGGPATFKVVSIDVTTTPNTAVLTFLGYLGDVASGNIVSVGTEVSPAGVQAPIGNNASFYSVAGTPFPLTTGFTAVVIASQTAEITLPSKGTFVLFSSAVFNLCAAIVPSEATLQMKLTRTNNSPGDVSNALVAFKSDSNGPLGNDNIDSDFQAALNGIIYSTLTAGDIIQINALSSVLSSGGTTQQITSAIITAVQIA